MPAGPRGTQRGGPRRPRGQEAEAPGPPPVAWRGGVQLGGSVVYCDAGRARDLVFLSHAHVAGRGQHGKLLASARTLELLAAHGPAPTGTALPLQFGRPLSLGALRIELFPSGHVPGAASLLLVDPGGRRIVYAGDVNPVPSIAEAAEVRGADVLVLEAPLASLPGRLPPRAEAHGRLVEAVRAALGARRTPVVLAPALGGAQEAVAALHAAEVALRLHPSVRAWTRACQAAGVALPPLPPAFRASERLVGAAVVWPLDLAGSAVLRRLDCALPIALTGQALDPRFAARAGVELAIPLADHADLPSLVEYVGHSGAREVYVTVGHGQALVEALGAIGARARPLGPPRQMELLPRS